MSGHSKWASIKHKKAATDAKRGQLFTKLARAIAIAAREGGGDPEANFTLAAAIEKARSYSMPKDNIQRAIDRGTGAGGAEDEIERAQYEGYGPGGAAILVEALTDNRNRTSADVRHAFERHGGNLGEPGSVAWVFEKRGVVLVDADRYGEDDLLVGDRRRRGRRGPGRRHLEGHQRASRPGESAKRTRGRRGGGGVEPISPWSPSPPSRSASRRRAT